MSEIAALNAVRRVPRSRQRAHRVLRARVAGARRAEGAPRVDGERAHRDSAHHRRQGNSHRQDAAVRDAVQAQARAGRLAHGRAQARADGDRGGARRRAASGPTWPFEDRAAVLLKAAELLATTARATVNAATMLGQAKTVFQSEIDAACELIDFWRFNVGYAQELYREQPINGPGVWNQLEYRPLEGFVYAVSPFNFTAIGGNLSTAPVLMGGVSIWKPASSAMLSAYYVMQGARGGRHAAGRDQLPAGQRRHDHGRAAGVAGPGGHPLHRQHRGLPEHVEDGRRRTSRATGPIRAWSAKPAARTSSSRTRRPTPQALAVAIVRGGFEYQGQKCSAASRIYVPQSLWKDVRDRVDRDDEGHQDGRRRATSATS